MMLCGVPGVVVGSDLEEHQDFPSLTDCGLLRVQKKVYLLGRGYCMDFVMVFGEPRSLQNCVFA